MTIIDTYNLLIEIADREEIKPDARKKWRVNGVPHKIRSHVWTAAHHQGLKIDPWVFDNFRKAEIKKARVVAAERGGAKDKAA